MDIMVLVFKQDQQVLFCTHTHKHRPGLSDGICHLCEPKGTVPCTPHWPTLNLAGLVRICCQGPVQSPTALWVLSLKLPNYLEEIRRDAVLTVLSSFIHSLEYTPPPTCVVLNMLEQFVVQTCGCVSEAHKDRGWDFSQVQGKLAFKQLI